MEVLPKKRGGGLHTPFLGAPPNPLLSQVNLTANSPKTPYVTICNLCEPRIPSHKACKATSALPVAFRKLPGPFRKISGPKVGPPGPPPCRLGHWVPNNGAPRVHTQPPMCASLAPSQKGTIPTTSPPHRPTIPSPFRGGKHLPFSIPLGYKACAYYTHLGGHDYRVLFFPSTKLCSVKLPSRCLL